MRRLCSVLTILALCLLGTTGTAAAKAKPKPLVYPVGYGVCFGPAEATTCVASVITELPSRTEPYAWNVCWTGASPLFAVEVHQTIVANPFQMKITTTQWVQLKNKKWQLRSTTVETLDGISYEEPVQVESCATNGYYASAGPFTSEFEAQQVAIQMEQDQNPHV